MNELITENEETKLIELMCEKNCGEKIKREIERILLKKIRKLFGLLHETNDRGFEKAILSRIYKLFQMIEVNNYGNLKNIESKDGEQKFNYIEDLPPIRFKKTKQQGIFI